MQIFHFDFNHVQLRLETVRRLLPELKELGYNAILWELEQQVRWESCPECATPESWSKEEFAALLAESRALGFEPIPLLQTIGHGEYVMRHAAYHHFREHPDYSDCYCTSKREVRRFLERWIGEYCELFGALRYFHLGGDEAYRFGTCSVCAQRDRIELYGEHIDELSAGLIERDIRPGIWHDMIVTEPAKLDLIKRNFIIWDWNYHDGVTPPETTHVRGHGTYNAGNIPAELRQEMPELLDADGRLATFHTARLFKRLGYDTIICSAARAYRDGPITPNITVHGPNIAGAAAVAEELGLMGHCVTSWALRLNPLQLSMPLVALPAIMARRKGGDYEAWSRELATRYFQFEEAWEAVAAVSRADSRLRTYSALQWTGLKDGMPTPPDYFRERIARWEAEAEPWWLNRGTMLAGMEAEVRRGIALLDRPGATPLGLAWRTAGELQLTYLRLLQDIFVKGEQDQTVVVRLQQFTDALARFYASEQAPLSAAANARLVTLPVVDYLVP